MWASTPTKNNLTKLFRKVDFERIIRPHPFSKIAEKGCGLTYGIKTRKALETPRVSRAFVCSKQAIAKIHC